jgi:hypothetical protein
LHFSGTGYIAAPLKDTTEKGVGDQSGQLDAQEDTKSTATIQGCVIRASDMAELPTI